MAAGIHIDNDTDMKRKTTPTTDLTATGPSPSSRARTARAMVPEGNDNNSSAQIDSRNRGRHGCYNGPDERAGEQLSDTMNESLSSLEEGSVATTGSSTTSTSSVSSSSTAATEGSKGGITGMQQQGRLLLSPRRPPSAAAAGGQKRRQLQTVVSPSGKVRRRRQRRQHQPEQQQSQQQRQQQRRADEKKGHRRNDTPPSFSTFAIAPDSLNNLLGSTQELERIERQLGAGVAATWDEEEAGEDPASPLPSLSPLTTSSVKSPTKSLPCSPLISVENRHAVRRLLQECKSLVEDMHTLRVAVFEDDSLHSQMSSSSLTHRHWGESSFSSESTALASIAEEPLLEEEEEEPSLNGHSEDGDGRSDTSDDTKRRTNLSRTPSSSSIGLDDLPDLRSSRRLPPESGPSSTSTSADPETAPPATTAYPEDTVSSLGFALGEYVDYGCSSHFDELPSDDDADIMENSDRWSAEPCTHRDVPPSLPLSK